MQRTSSPVSPVTPVTEDTLRNLERFRRTSPNAFKDTDPAACEFFVTHARGMRSKPEGKAALLAARDAWDVLFLAIARQEETVDLAPPPDGAFEMIVRESSVSDWSRTRVERLQGSVHKMFVGFCKFRASELGHEAVVLHTMMMVFRLFELRAEAGALVGAS